MTGDLSGGLVAAGQLTTFRCDFVLIQVDQVDYSQLVTHGDAVRRGGLSEFDPTLGSMSVRTFQVAIRRV